MYVSSSIESCILQNAGARRTKQGLVVVDIAYDKILRVERKEPNTIGVQKAALIAFGRYISRLHVVTPHLSFFIAQVLTSLR